jgi:hypothetical protein
MRNDETGLFPVLEAALKAAKEPLDANDLYDMPSIKNHAASMNRVSDYLGNLWRKGFVTRSPAPKGRDSRCLWVYQWKGNKGPKIYDHALEYTPRVIADRPSVLITEEGNTITLEFPNLVIVVKGKIPPK